MTVLQVHDRRVPAGGALALDGGRSIVYVAEGAARIGELALGANEAAHADPGTTIGTGPGARLLVWSLVPTAAQDALLAAAVEVPGKRILRADRVDFPPGGVAFLHTHQGPGIRVLVDGAFAVETEGRREEIDRWDAWFEAGPDPVYAEVRGDAPAAFVRVMVLPEALLGRSSISYVRDEDAARPKSQRYTVFVDHPIGVVGP